MLVLQIPLAHACLALRPPVYSPQKMLPWVEPACNFSNALSFISPRCALQTPCTVTRHGRLDYVVDCVVTRGLVTPATLYGCAQVVYDYADSLPSLSCFKYSLATAFPRR